ncbi:hypothetical protein BH10PAT1_BH10PAT1_2600 [soil metagenome]
MSYLKEALIEIEGDTIIFDHIAGNPEIDWVDIVSIPQRPSNANTLFVASHSKGEGGWDHGFDRRPYAVNAATENNWHLIVDETVDAKETNHIQVRSIDEFSKKLYEAARSTTNPYVIGVTGSVGKTTTIAFMEHLLKTSNIDVTRFYSKRLSPLSVMTHYINRINKDTSVIVMEYSAYLKNHISQLSNLLPPDISFLLNIYNTHIAEGLFKNQHEIFDSKIRIKPPLGIGFVNQKILDNLEKDIPSGWNSFNLNIPDFSTNKYLPPTLRSTELYTAGMILAKEMNLSENKAEEAYASFVPQEHRIDICEFNDKNIFFHGETSGGSRLLSWFETPDKSVPWMFVEEINFAEENPQGFKDLLVKVFNSDKTFILDTPSNREKLPVNANFVSNQKFEDLLKKSTGYIVYHKGLSSRRDDFNPTTYLKQRWNLSN